MTASGPTSPRRVELRREKGLISRTDDVATEEPLEIRVDDEPLAVTMRTPGHDEELAAGFCLTEGIAREPDDVESVETCREADYGNVVLVRLSEAGRRRAGDALGRARREMFLSSSCGLCGKQTIDRIEQRVAAPTGRFRVRDDVLASLPETMRADQTTFASTGGLHAAALFDVDGRLGVLREDIGRHNAVDKVIGHRLLHGRVPIDPAVLLVSGRASFEVVQKAAAAGIAVVCAVSAPSSMAIDLAVRLDMTLIGFLRPGRMNVYHDPGRIER